MTDIITMTETSAFYLRRQTTSVFDNINCREYPDMPLIYGFLENQMGIKLRKHIAKTYSDEQTHYRNYIGVYDHDNEYIKSSYSINKHSWGRVNPNKSLSLSLFHRPSRHSFATKNYLDFDMINAHPQLLLGFAKLQGLETKGLEEYCANPKQCRYAIAEYYKLKNIVSDDGVVITAYEQAKKLPLRLAFGGSLDEWIKDYVCVRVQPMPLVVDIVTTLLIIRENIVDCNPHIRTDLEKYNDKWCKKNEVEKNRSIMALFAQTWERIIQEYCIAHLVRTFKLQLGDIIPSQDGFMPLKKVIEDNKIDIPILFETFNRIVKKQFKIDIKWDMKAFDEAIFIKPSDVVPITITLLDLEMGETRIAQLIKPELKKKLIYNNKTEKWYYTNKKNIWLSTKHPDELLMSNTIQRYIQIEIDTLLKDLNKTEDKEIRKIINDNIKLLRNHYKMVGKPNYGTQLSKFLRTMLVDDDFHNKLDKMGGRMVFNDGIFDFKKNEFRKCIFKEDYLTFTLSFPYPVETNIEKMKKLKLEMKKILNWNDTHLDYYLSILGYAFTGDAHLEKSIYYIVDGTDGGKGDNGKTFLFDVLRYIFPEYVKQTDPKLLDDNNTKTHKQLPELNGARIVWADEGTKKKINASLLKKIADGMTINTDVMYGNTVDLFISYKMFVCSNHIPKIDKDEEAVYNRYKQIQFCSHFDRKGVIFEDDFANLDFIADTKLGDDLKDNYRNELVSVILEYGVLYYIDGIPSIPQQFIDATNKTKTENNEFAVWFYEHFEEKVGSNVSLDFIVDLDGKDRKTLIKELGGMGIKYNKDMVGFDKKKNDKGEDVPIKGGIAGFVYICNASL